MVLEAPVIVEAFVRENLMFPTFVTSQEIWVKLVEFVW